MKNTSFFKVICIGVLLILVSNCDDDDPCDVRHVVINGECVPDYVFPENKNLKSGDKFYHTKHGIIIFKDGDWYTNKGKLIPEMNTKKN